MVASAFFGCSLVDMFTTVDKKVGSRFLRNGEAIEWGASTNRRALSIIVGTSDCFLSTPLARPRVCVSFLLDRQKTARAPHLGRNRKKTRGHLPYKYCGGPAETETRMEMRKIADVGREAVLARRPAIKEAAVQSKGQTKNIVQLDYKSAGWRKSAVQFNQRKNGPHPKNGSKVIKQAAFFLSRGRKFKGLFKH